MLSEQGLQGPLGGASPCRTPLHKGKVLGTRVLRFWVLEPSGLGCVRMTSFGKRLDLSRCLAAQVPECWALKGFDIPKSRSFGGWGCLHPGSVSNVNRDHLRRGRLELPGGTDLGLRCDSSILCRRRNPLWAPIAPKQAPNGSLRVSRSPKQGAL